MKKLFQLAACILTGVCITVNAFAEKDSTVTIKPWVPTKGFWVAESNIFHPKQGMLYFYTNDQQLVYRETFNDWKVNLKKRRTLMRLKEVLDSCIVAWEHTGVATANEGRVARAFGLKPQSAKDVAAAF